MYRLQMFFGASALFSCTRDIGCHLPVLIGHVKDCMLNMIGVIISN